MKERRWKRKIRCDKNCTIITVAVLSSASFEQFIVKAPATLWTVQCGNIEVEVEIKEGC